MALQRRIEVHGWAGAGDVYAIAARLIERIDGAQQRWLCCRERSWAKVEEETE
jgi:hypothetical protein